MKLQRTMVVLPLACSVPAPIAQPARASPRTGIAFYGAALYADAGPDEGDLVGEVEEVARLQTLRHLQLRGRLEQEDTLRLALVDHVVDAGIIRVHPSDVGPTALPLLHEVESLLDLVEHGQGEDV